MPTVIEVRLAGPADLDALSRLCHEMERHDEGAAAVPYDTARERVAAALFGGPRPAAEALLAEVVGAKERGGRRAVGFAIFAPLFPAGGLTTGLFLKDLFVGAENRRRGVGRALVAALARLALERGYTRIDWTAGRNARGARALYRALGAAERDAVCYRLEGGALRALARRGAGG